MQTKVRVSILSFISYSYLMFYILYPMRMQRIRLPAHLQHCPDPSKRPTLATSAALATHMAQSAAQRQLILAEAKVSELENALRERDARAERLEADLRMVVEREEKEKGARGEVERELAVVTVSFTFPFILHCLV